MARTCGNDGRAVWEQQAVTAILVVETAVLALLCLFVGGLLRSHAAILRRLHALDGGETRPPMSQEAMTHTAPAYVLGMNGSAASGVEGRPIGATAADVFGTTVDGGAAAIRIGHVPHQTVLVFLSSGCATCQAFWSALGDPSQVHLPLGTRLVVVTKDLAEESPAELMRLRPPALDVVASSRAWHDYSVPGSPFVVSVDGPSGQVTGEGTGMDWAQVSRLLAQATGDVTFLASNDRRVAKPTGDAEREARVDRELMNAGILPGDPSLFPSADPGDRAEAG
ncbi:MAG: hypothetical protein JWL70_1315 [Acidimicrobiia bacterium]|nr:hypothetical protein [Acidimicrobiia bacterium]